MSQKSRKRKIETSINEMRGQVPLWYPLLFSVLGYVCGMYGMMFLLKFDYALPFYSMPFVVVGLTIYLVMNTNRLLRK